MGQNPLFSRKYADRCLMTSVTLCSYFRPGNLEWNLHIIL